MSGCANEISSKFLIQTTGDLHVCFSPMPTPFALTFFICSDFYRPKNPSNYGAWFLEMLERRLNFPMQSPRNDARY